MKHMLNKIGATGLVLIMGFLTFVYVNFTEQQINQYPHFTKLAFIFPNMYFRYCFHAGPIE